MVALHDINSFVRQLEAGPPILVLEESFLLTDLDHVDEVMLRAVLEQSISREVVDSLFDRTSGAAE